MGGGCRECVVLLISTTLHSLLNLALKSCGGQSTMENSCLEHFSAVKFLYFPTFFIS